MIILASGEEGKHKCPKNTEFSYCFGSHSH